MSQYGFLFDLDGVIVDTAKYHFLAWKRLADELDIPFTEQDNERLKGVSRMASLEIILEIGNERAYFEAAFPQLPVFWLETSAGEDQVLLVTRRALAAQTQLTAQ